ncbi:putative NAD(P)H dehydrogenase (quinone) FQR1-like 1 [Hordeum vulgare]|nr:putative NAD(P)H dehydrogenase (quinone) FQR1-like 1 [Hordeum vulgare]
MYRVYTRSSTVKRARLGLLGDVYVCYGTPSLHRHLANNEVYEDDLVDYDEEVENIVDGATANPSVDVVKNRLSPVAPPPPQRRDRTFIPAPAPRPVRIYVVFYSTYGHVRRLARAVQRGVGSVPGALGILLRVPETLPDAVLSRMGALEAAAEMDAEGILVADPGGLPDADGFLFGFPARYGAMAEQMQAFFDSTAPLCRGQRLAGKPAGFFVSTGTQCGGQETTA